MSDTIQQEDKAHIIWWSTLSINEQKYYISKHPFFSKMGMNYFEAHKTSLKQVYDNVIENNLLVDYEVVRELAKTQKFI